MQLFLKDRQTHIQTDTHSYMDRQHLYIPLFDTFHLIMLVKDMLKLYLPDQSSKTLPWRIPGFLRR
jgi:hypothetical protein